MIALLNFFRRKPQPCLFEPTPSDQAASIRRKIDRAERKSEARGLTLDFSRIDTHSTWRTPIQAGAVQYRWDARHAKRSTAVAWSAAREYLPKDLVDAMSEPGQKGVMEAMMRNSDLRLMALHNKERGADVLCIPDMKASIEACMNVVRFDLDPPNGCYQKFYGDSQSGPDALIWHWAGHLVVAEIASAAQVAIESQLDTATPEAAAQKRAVRL